VDYHKANLREQNNSIASWLKRWGLQFLSLLILGSVLLWLAHPWVNRVVETMARQPGLAVAWGLLGLILTPLLSIALLVTFIGTPLGVLLLALYGAGLLLASVFVAYELGRWLLRKRPQASPYANLAAGALIVSFGTTLPGIGWLILLITLISGLGALMLWEGNLFSQWRKGIAV